MKKALIVIILLFVVFLYTKPFFQPGFFSTHDGEWAIVRLAEMRREIKDVQIPPRLSDYLNHGFGYPLFSFTYPAPYYLGAILKLFGFGLTDSIKILFVASVIFSAFFMYLLGRKLVGDLGGLLGAVFYTAAPFRLVDLYVRGSLGESLSFALFPALFYFCLVYIEKPDSKKMILNSLLLALLVLTHNVTAFLFFPILLGFSYIAVRFYKKDVIFYSWRYLSPMLVLGLGLAVYFFVPAILEKKYLILSKIQLADIVNNFVNLTDYLSAIGWIYITAALLGLIFLFFDKKKNEYSPFFWFIGGTITILVFFASPHSAFLWRYPPLSWFDFPWRLLTPLTFIISFTTIFLNLLPATRLIGVILAILAIFLNLTAASPTEYINKPDTYYATNDATTTSMDELMPIWVIDKPKNRYQEKVEVINGQAVISDLKYNSKHTTFHIKAEIPAAVKVNTIYFPGWQITVDGKKLAFDYSNQQGLIYFLIPAGSHEIKVQFKETPVRLVSDWISIVSFGIVIILLINNGIPNLFRRLKKILNPSADGQDDNL